MYVKLHVEAHERTLQPPIRHTEAGERQIDGGLVGNT